MRRNRRGRGGAIELNFDGLTDAVTNLVGSLILLVVLVVAVTGPKQQGVEELPVEDNTSGEVRPMDPLLEKLQRLRDEIASVERDIGEMAARLPELEVDIQEFRKQSAKP